MFFVRVRHTLIVSYLVVCFVKLNESVSNINRQTILTEDDKRAAETESKTDLKQSQTRSIGLWAVGQNNQNEYENYPSAEGHGYNPYGYSYNNVLTPAYYAQHYGYNQNYDNNEYYHNQGYYGLANGYNNFAHTGYDNNVQDYEYNEHNNYNDNHESGGLSKHKSLTLKKLLLPLAGLALLGTAAALSSNPVLLQLGTISSGRKKRSLSDENVYPLNTLIKPHK